jgi:hypothetical protein
MSNTQQHIQIGHKFFQNEKRAYSNWQHALVRECLQNSFDVKGCTQIDITVENTVITISDNGSGMSREILTNVFMNLGETTKGIDDCGGFGIARNLICFAQNSYQILSHDYHVTGNGASYQVNDAPYRKGCCFIIDTGVETNWCEIIRNIILKCNVSKRIYLNGEEIRNTSHRGRHLRDFSFGSVYVNKSDKNNRVIVRSNGVWMFDRYSNMGATVYVEVSPELSKEVFTSNRDGLQDEYNRELNAFLNELASESISALKVKNYTYQKVVKIGKAFQAQPKAKTNKIIPIHVDAQPSIPTKEISVAAFRLSTIDEQKFIVDRILEPYTNPSYEKSETFIDYSAIVNESNSLKIKVISEKFNPLDLQPNETRYKLLKIWWLICQYVTEEYATLKGYNQNYAIGWIFSDDCEAQCRTMEQVKYLLLNPVDYEGKIKYSINNKEDLAKLIVVAIHEVCHLSDDASYHNETFASDMTQLAIKILPKVNEIYNIVKKN